MYNAYDRDIAVVNIFFGESTVFGEGNQNKIRNIGFKVDKIMFLRI